MKTKIIVSALALALSGCQVIGGYIGAHQTGILLVGATAGAVNQVESAAINGIALAKEVKQAAAGK